MQRVQLVVAKAVTSCAWMPSNQKPGAVVWVTEAAARHLLEAGLCRWPELKPVPVVEAAQRKPLGLSPAWPIDRFSVVERAWEGQTVVCIGGGPSLTREQLADIEAARLAGRCRVIAVNDAYLVAPFADICYFADSRWWEWHTKGIAKVWPWVSFSAAQVREAFAAYAGQKCTIGETGMMVADPNVFMLHNDTAADGDPRGLSARPNALRTGTNGGYQAVNLAVLTGGNPILLIAYDMRFQGGRSHSHNGHPLKNPEGQYSLYAKHFNTMVAPLDALGVRVINCTPGSAITAFPRGDLASLLSDPPAAVVPV